MRLFYFVKFERIPRRAEHDVSGMSCKIPCGNSLRFVLTRHCCSFQFLLIFRKAAAGELAQDSGLYELYQQVEEIDVDKEGVKGAATFFEAKVSLT